MLRLVERGEQLRLLDAATDRAFHAHGEIVLIAGEAGVGKTTLLRAFVEGLQPGTTFAWGACDALHTPRPLGPMMDMAAALGPEFRRIVHKSDQTSDHFIEMIEAIERLGHGIVLVFEDVHWADNATLDLLKYLCRRVLALKLLIVISHRNDEVGPSHPLSALVGDLPARLVNRIDLAGLSPDGVAELAKQFGHSGDGVYELTGGNAFFTTELLSQPQSGKRDLPQSIRAAIQTRLARLSLAEQELVGALSVVPNVMDRNLLSYIDADFGYKLASVSLNSGILLETPDGSVRFRHELARLAVLSLHTPNQQRDQGSRILRILCEHPKLVESHLDLVAHCAATADDADAILTYAPRAAERAAKLGAHKEAVAHLALALRFADRTSDAVAAQLYEDWAYEAGLADQITDEVIAARHTAIGLWQKVGRIDKVGHNYRWLWRLHWYRGEPEEAELAAQTGLELLQLSPPSGELAMAYSTQSQINFLHNRLQKSIDWARQALELARHFSDVATQVHAMTNIGSSLLFRNDPQGRSYMEESLALARKHDLHEHAARVYTNYAEYAIIARDFELAEKLTAEGIAFDTRLTLDSWTYYLVGRQAQLRLEQGRLRDAVTIARGVLAIKKLTVVMHMPAMIVLARAQARIGSVEADELFASTMDAAQTVGEVQYIIPIRIALIEQAYVASRLAVAKSELGKLLRLEKDILQPWDRSAVALWAHRLELNPPPSIELDPASPEALEVGGDPLGAAREYLALGMPFDAAFARLHCRGESQVEELSKAIGELDALGMLAAADLGRRWANACGMEGAMPRRRRGPYRAARSHPLGLTVREVEILRCMVDGASNREIADQLCRSQRTVEHHVAAILTKLSAPNRMQAALRALSEPWLLELK